MDLWELVPAKAADVYKGESIAVGKGTIAICTNALCGLRRVMALGLSGQSL